MLILAFDTTESSLSVALLDDEKILAKNIILENAKHSELLIVEIEKLLRARNIWYEDLDLIATTNGPGSFTGVRVGLTAARTMRIALDIPLILLNSCEVLAYKYRKENKKILVIMDAKADEFFIAEFLAKDGELSEIKASRLVKKEEVKKNLPNTKFIICGSGSENKDTIEAELVGLLALKKFRQGKITTDFNPSYLREPRIEKRKK